MSDQSAAQPPSHSRSNPFSSRNVRPGAMPFLFASNEAPAQLVERLRAAAWWGEIIGPHGSGKSALVAAIAPQLAVAGRRVLSISLHDGQRHLRAFAGDLAAIDRQCLVVVDGYEQLSWFSRLRLKRFCRRRRCGLLVTAHEPVGLPRLYTTRPTLEMAERIAASLVDLKGSAIRRDDIARAFAVRGGNLREVLFDLYDLYEERRGGRA
jgi:hypothetical protein